MKRLRRKKFEIQKTDEILKIRRENELKGKFLMKLGMALTAIKLKNYNYFIALGPSLNVLVEEMNFLPIPIPKLFRFVQKNPTSKRYCKH